MLNVLLHAHTAANARCSEQSCAYAGLLGQTQRPYSIGFSRTRFDCHAYCVCLMPRQLHMQGAENSPVPMQVCRGRHSSPTALASATHAHCNFALIVMLVVLVSCPDNCTCKVLHIALCLCRSAGADTAALQHWHQLQAHTAICTDCYAPRPSLMQHMQHAYNSPVPMQVCRGRHSSPTALASAAHTLLFLLYKLPDKTLHDFAAGELYAWCSITCMCC